MSCLLSALALAWFVVPTVAPAQPLQLGFSRPGRPQLTEPQVNVVSGATAARLEQSRALAADKNWDDAVDILRELATDASDKVVDIGDGRFVSLRTFCHLELARMPADALSSYRRRVDALAERWYRDGLAARDSGLLSRVVDELFCSSWGDDALLALGELALERGDYAAARRAWEQISPFLRDPAGRPMWLALRDIDLDKHWPAVERRWRERSKPPAWLVYPDSQLDLADVRAQLLLASIRAGESDRAALELDVFRRLHPDAVGRLGGQDGPYVAALERLLVSARDWPAQPRDANWPTFAGSQDRSPAAAKLGPITGPAWAEPVKLEFTSMVPRDGKAPGAFSDRAEAQARESARPLSFFPVAANGLVFYSDATRIHVVDLAAGRPAIAPGGVLYRDEPLDESAQRSRFGADWGVGHGVAHGVPRYTLTVSDGILYGRIGRLATAVGDARDRLPGGRIIGLDLRRDGVLAFGAGPENAAWSFDGVPVGDDRRLFVAMRHSDVTPHAYVACFDLATRNTLWRTAIGAADTPAAGLGDEITHNLLTLAGERIYFNTNLGLVAALDANTGSICWLHRYERLSGETLVSGRPGPLHFDRDPSPCLVHDGLVIVAPADSPQVFALDAETGQTVWRNDQLPDALHLLGVVRRNLIVSGNRLWAIDLRSGKLRFVWPESEHAGIRGLGRGVVAGDEIYWPTRSEIYVIHGVTGARSRTPISLGSISDGGANLAAAHGRLLVAGHDKLMAFGPALSVPPNRKESPKTEPVATND